MEDLNTMSKKTVLVIDDEEPILKMTKGMLKDVYDVTTVNSGEAALDLFSSGFFPNLVLLDLYMSEMGGWNVLINIRDLCESHKTLIAMYTSSNDPEGMAKAKQFGAVGFIQKPISRGELLEEIAKLVN